MSTHINAKTASNAKTISVKLDADIRTRLENLAEARQRTAH
jgi:predicted transcriptional regulator